MIARRAKRFLLLAVVIAMVALAVGLSVLLAWALDIDSIKRVAPQFVTMKANTALAFILAGASLLGSIALHIGLGPPIFVRRVVRGLAASILAIGVATLVEYVLQIDLHFDQLLFIDSDPAAAHPGRMAQNTAVNFTCLGLALLFPEARVRSVYPSQWLAILIFMISYVALLAYAYDFESLYRIVAFESMAVHTVVVSGLLAVGVLASRPSIGFMRHVLGEDTRGVALRTVVPVALLLPPVLNWLEVRISGRYNDAFGAALVAVLNVGMFVGLGWWTARSLGILEQARNAAQTIVKTSEERLRIALQSARAGAWDWNLTDNAAWWSPEMYELLSVEPKAPMRLDDSLDLIFEADQDHVRKSIRAAIENRIPYRCEFRLQADPRRCMISHGRVIFDAHGKPTRLIGISFDITDQKRIERELRHLNDALSQSNADLKRYAHIAAHDLQTPLRSIASFAELLVERAGSELRPQARDWLQRIVESVRHMQSLVLSLLQYAGIESVTHIERPVALNEAFDRVVRLLHEPIEASRALVVRGELPVVSGDPMQLDQLLLNLISNALKYRSAKPPSIQVSARRQASSWLLAVKDNGLGIDERHHGRIFEMFERLHTQNAVPGTGMGLAICRKIVERHGGTLWVESSPGQGSTFYFTLPAEDEPALPLKP